jgi:DNA-binding beta-propeller fold protein YncE
LEVNGTFWVLAGSHKARNLQLVASHGRKYRITIIVPLNTSATCVTQVPAGLLVIGQGSGRVGSLQIRNGRTGALQTTLPMPGGVYAVATSPDGATYYALVRSGGSSSVLAVNAANHQVINDIPVPNASKALVYDSARQILVVLVGHEEIDEIVATTGQIASSFSVSPPAAHIALSPDDGTLYVLRGTSSSANISVIDLNTESQTASLPAPAHAVGLQVTLDGSYLATFVGSKTYGNVQLFSLHRS